MGAINRAHGYATYERIVHVLSSEDQCQDGESSQDETEPTLYWLMEVVKKIDSTDERERKDKGQCQTASAIPGCGKIVSAMGSAGAPAK